MRATAEVIPTELEDPSLTIQGVPSTSPSMLGSSNDGLKNRLDGAGSWLVVEIGISEVVVSAVLEVVGSSVESSVVDEVITDVSAVSKEDDSSVE